MKFFKLFILLFGTIAISCNPNQEKEKILLANLSKTDLGSDGFAQFFFWEFDENKSLWGEEPEGLTGVQGFRDTLEMVLGESRFQQVVNKELIQSYSKDSLLQIKNGDHFNAMLVHTGTVGKVRPINSLEAQILNYQLNKYPLLSHPTEFHAFIAYHPEQATYRVYFGSSDQPWPPKPVLLIQQLESDIKNGWKLRYHLHNHYEPASNGYLGIMAPSMADAQYFKMLLENYHLEKALITNGIHTVEINSKTFEYFEAHQ